MTSPMGFDPDDTGQPLPADIAQWPELAREEFEERAAIMEHEGGMTRRQADRAAWERVKGLWTTKGRKP